MKQANKCLLLTSFSDTNLRLKEELRKSLLKRDIILTHPADLISSTPLLDGLLGLLREADVLIADVSDYNPNILFEIGWAIGAGLPVIMIADHDLELPMSLSSVSLIRYDKKPENIKRLTSKLVSALEELKLLPLGRGKKVETIRDQEQKAFSGNPFTYITTESIPGDTELLAKLFVPPPYFERVCGPETVVLIGPRGCGKTMLLQMMRLRNRISIDEDRTNNVAGFYVNFNSALRYLNAEKKALSNSRKTAIYFNLLFLHALVNELDTLFRSERIPRNQEIDVLSAIGRTINAPIRRASSLSVLSAEIADSVERARADLPIERSIAVSVSNGLFLSNLAEALCKGTSIFSYRHIAYLLDDYANDWLPEATCQTLNSIIFQRSSCCAFKVATIPGRQNFSLGQGRLLELSADYDLVNMTDSSLTDLHYQMRFLRAVLDNRLRVAGGKLNSKSLFGLRPSKPDGADYSGIEALARLCTGDYRSIIDICNRMVTKNATLDRPVPRELQNNILRSYSTELVDELGRGVEWGEYVSTFVESMMRFLRAIFESSDYKAKTKAKAMYTGFVLREFDELDAEAKGRLMWLIRSGVLHTSAGIREGLRLEIRRMIFPAFKVPITRYDNFLILDSYDLENMLKNPAIFWKMWQCRLASDRQ
jgi:hypothetical protein